jgi:hypothetical protein
MSASDAVTGTEMSVWSARQRLVFAMTGGRDVSACCHDGRSLCSTAGNLVASRALGTLIVVKFCDEGLCSVLQVADNLLM